MKYTINNISTGEDEVIVNYLRMTPEVERIVNFIKGEQTKLIGWRDKEQKLIDIKTILYIETVDGNTFAYTDDEVFKLDYTLTQLEQLLNDINFFRCSKSMIINIDKVLFLLFLFTEIDKFFNLFSKSYQHCTSCTC